jgi:hypothetical protein
MPASLEEMFSKQINNPDDLIGQQYQFLKDLSYLPKMTSEWLPGGEEGVYNNWENTLKVSPSAVNMERSFAHELQHAVDHAYDRLKANIKRNPSPSTEEKQFLEAYKKIEEPTKISKEGLNSYRAARNESQAYGVANSRYPGGEYAGTPHLDTTMATEQAILFDLAKRANKNAPKSQPKQEESPDKNYTFREWLNKYMSK